MEFYLYGHKTKKGASTQVDGSDRNYINKFIKRNLEDIIPTFGPIHPNPGVQLTSPRNQHRSSCNFSEDFTTIFDLENTRYCALPSREESYRLIPFVEESSVPIEDKMSNPKVFYHLNNLSLLEEASLPVIYKEKTSFHVLHQHGGIGNPFGVKNEHPFNPPKNG
ncbi:hypothetical protein Anas_12829, partial [Armadillidium nasatum]